MSDSSAENEIRKWLGSPAGEALTRKLAKRVYHRLHSHSLSLYRHGGESVAVESAEAAVLEIQSELTLFVLENRGGLQKRLMAAGAQKGAYLQTAFTNHLIDRSRNPAADPFRYMYKRVRDLMDSAPGFHLIAKPQKGSAFSMRPQNRFILPLDDEDLESIPFPYGRIQSVDFQSVNKKDAILELAAYFWKCVSRMWEDAPVWTDIRDFVRWLQRHISLGDPAVEERGDVSKNVRGKRRPEQKDGGGSYSDDIFESVPDVQAQPDRLYYDPDRIKTWAENFANGLSPKEAEVFYLRYEAGMGFEEIANKLGYQGPSGPKYRLDQIEAKLRYFLVDLPWVSPDGRQNPNPEAFDLFQNTLLLFLKKSFTEP